MPSRWLSALLVPIAFSACAAGEEPDRDAVKATSLPAWISPKSQDPAAAEFREVVELCATRPDTPAFNNRWSRFIGRYHEPGLDVAAVVDQVIRQAEARRRELPKDPRWMAPAVSPEALRAQMLAVAETALSETRH